MLAEALMLALPALAAAQAPPPPVLLTATKSGVDPVVPTPFAGVETIEGAITYDGPPIPGFTGPGGKASAQSNLPAAMFRADLPSTNFDNLTGSTITGSITGKSTQGGSGVTFTVDFKGFPDEAKYGPFVYHIHGLPVPADGNCSATLGHLDPTNRGELHACDVAAPETCQAGDLAGKHGNITTASFTASYAELYLSTDPSSPYYFGDKSVVIHSMNTTRLTCANFKMMSSGSNSSAGAGGASATGSGGSGSPTGASPTMTPYNGAASNLALGAAGAGTVMMGLFAALFL